MAESPVTTSEYEDILTRVRHSNAETEKFIAEARKRSLDVRDDPINPCIVLLSGMAAGTVLFGAGMAFAKLLRL